VAQEAQLLGPKLSFLAVDDQAKLFFLTIIQVAIKKSIEWRLQVQIAFLTEVDLAPSRTAYPCKEFGLQGTTILPAGRNSGHH
jgi:hypothetical protein